MMSGTMNPEPDVRFQTPASAGEPSIHSQEGAQQETETPEGVSGRYALICWLLIVGLGVGIWQAGAAGAADGYPSAGWRLLAVFMPTVLALMLRPIPGGAAVLIGVLAAILLARLPPEKALAGYADPTVWLVLAAYFISRAFIKTGLARRIALTFVRFLGRNSLGLSYAMLASDTLLAGMIPSNAARVGGVILPITRGLAELYQSRPGRTAGLLGCYLMLTLYQGDVMACALFLTGQASNPLAASQAMTELERVGIHGFSLSYANWFWYALAPAGTCLLLIPLLIYLWQRPGITHTPEAVAMARRELEIMGPMSRSERILFGVFVGVCGLWITLGPAFTQAVGLGADFADRLGFTAQHYTAVVALLGTAVLLLSGVLTWDDCVTEKAAWDVFIWYGGLVLLGKQLGQTRILEEFAHVVADSMGGWGWLPLFVASLLVYFYAHYAFASITVHLVSMYPAFVSVLLAAGAPPLLVVSVFAFTANFAAGLTHYGTTPAPIVFSLGYVSQPTWWKVGLGMSLVNLGIWLTIGMLWWKLVGLW